MFSLSSDAESRFFKGIRPPAKVFRDIIKGYLFLPILSRDSDRGSSRLCVIIFAYRIVKCLLGKTFRTILRIFYQYRPRFHTETRRARSPQ